MNEMVRTVNILSVVLANKLSLPEYYGDGTGLWLLVSKSGSKSWVFRFTLAGRRREMGLGALHTVSLGLARGKAKHRAGGIFAILGELARAGLLDTSLPTVHGPTMDAVIEKYDVRCSDDRAMHQLFRAAPGGGCADAGGVLAVRALREERSRSQRRLHP